MYAGRTQYVPHTTLNPMARLAGQNEAMAL